MEATGILMAMVDIPSEYQAEYNRWYDLDHVPEHVSKPDVLWARRYVAPWRLRKAPGVQTDAMFGHHAPYLSTYLLGGAADPFSAESIASWPEKDRELIKAGRFFREGKVAHVSRWRIASTYTRPEIHVAPAAVPYLAHAGVVIAAGRATSPEAHGSALDWLEKTHLVDLLSTKGVIAAIRLEPTDPSGGGSIVSFLLCEENPGDVMANIDRDRRFHKAVGRYPAHRGVYEQIALLPYEAVTPFDYSFEFDDPGQ